MRTMYSIKQHAIYIEAFKNEQTTRECWETFKEILHEFG